MNLGDSARRDVGIAPYAVRTNLPENGSCSGVCCRVVEDADPYDDVFA